MELPDLSEVFATHAVAVAYLFGSRAEGTARPASDHDVAVLFTGPAPALDATVRLAAALSAVLDTDVDVVDLDRAPSWPRRLGHISDTVAQISIDLANHVIAADGYRVPRDYGDAFRVLARIAALVQP